MNKSILNCIVCLLLLTALFFACNKEKQEKQELVKTENISKDDDMSAYLKQFKEKMLSSSKYDETLSTEDARWHLEAVLNYTYGDAGHETSDIQYDTFQCKLQTNEGMVLLSDLGQVFNLISQNVEQVLSNCSLPNKSILAIRTQLIDDNDNDNDDITLLSIINTRGSSYPTQYYVDSTDYWYEDDYSGKCGPYQGTCLGTGAVQIIQNRINSNHPNYYCPTGYVYYTDFQDIIIYYDIIESMPDANSPHGYRIPVFTCPSNQAPMCLSPDEINYYIVEGLELTSELAPNGKVFYSMTNTYSEAVPIGYHFAYHEYCFRYAKPNCGGSLN